MYPYLSLWWSLNRSFKQHWWLLYLSFKMRYQQSEKTFVELRYSSFYKSTLCINQYNSWDHIDPFHWNRFKEYLHVSSHEDVLASIDGWLTDSLITIVHTSLLITTSKRCKIWCRVWVPYGLWCLIDHILHRSLKLIICNSYHNHCILLLL